MEPPGIPARFTSSTSGLLCAHIAKHFGVVLRKPCLGSSPIREPVRVMATQHPSLPRRHFFLPLAARQLRVPSTYKAPPISLDRYHEHAAGNNPRDNACHVAENPFVGRTVIVQPHDVWLLS